MAYDVVVGQHPGGGGADGAGGGQGLVDDGPHRPGVPGAVQEAEVEGLVQLVGPDVQGEPLGRGRPGLGDADARARIGVEQPPPGAVDLVDAVLVEEGERLGPDQGGLGAAADVGQAGGLDHAVGDVDAEAVDTEVEPEAQDGGELLRDLGALPVQVGLLGGEEVQVPRAVRGPGPGGPAEDGLPVVGRPLPARSASGAEVVPGPGGAPRFRGEGLPEPDVPVGGVVGHHVHDDPQAQRVGGPDELVGVGEVPEERIDGAVVGDVVAAVGLRGDVEGGEPHGVDPEPGQVGQARAHPAEVADAVAVAVREGAHVHLVDDCIAPPADAFGRLAGSACKPGCGQLMGHTGVNAGTCPLVAGLMTRRKFEQPASRGNRQDTRM